ncbi:MAG: hypothetical protein QXR48_02640 [Candidatus Woesearchaeota archaeon]
MNKSTIIGRLMGFVLGLLLQDLGLIRLDAITRALKLSLLMR